MLTLKKLKAIRNAVRAFELIDDEKPFRVVFTTQRDFRVDDKICLPLAGIAFHIDDPLRPIIPDDTHPRCRCYYVDEATGQIVTDISSRRDVKHRNNLTNRQRKNVVKKDKKYLTQKKVDLIIEYMDKNQKWQSKSKTHKPRSASIAKILKWVQSIE